MLNLITLVVELIDTNSDTIWNWCQIENILLKFQDGITLSDIESILTLILLIRFLILSIRYNLKTSFYITFIGLAAGYLWYRHLIDLISMYRNTLLNIPFLESFGMDALNLREYHYQATVENSKISDDIHWYEFGKLIYYAFRRGIIEVNPETNSKMYIDPISMVISNLDTSSKMAVLPIYYKIYNQILPRIFIGLSKFWTQLSGIAAYGLVTRIGKRYCPYLIRWHWTALLILSVLEPFLQYFIMRAEFFQNYILSSKLILTNPQAENFEILNAQRLLQYYSSSGINITPDFDVHNQLLFQYKSLNILISSLITIHIGFILIALFHAIWGQYFYLPFITENVELHIGSRPKNSLYSGGNTAWQNLTEKENNLNQIFPKLWYGWFGRGTQKQLGIIQILKGLINNIKKTI